MEKKMIFNPYSKIYFLSRRAFQKDMEKYGSETMKEEDRKKMVSALCVMNVRDPEFVPCRYLNEEIKEKGIVTKTGIWINPTLSEPESNYVRYELAKKIFFNKKSGILIIMVKSSLAMFSLMTGLGLLTLKNPAPFYSMMFTIISGYLFWKITKKERKREIRSQDSLLKILKRSVENEEKHRPLL